MRTLTVFLVSAAFFFSLPAARAAALRTRSSSTSAPVRATPAAPPQTPHAPLGLADLGLLVLPGQDAREVGTDDTTLVLDRLARALLGNLLGDTLLVDATVDNGPRDLARVLALEEEGLLLGSDEAAWGQRQTCGGGEYGERGRADR